ncbi:MAG: F0F1 ATP synthase subunit C [Candidatus Hydrogenedentes bacterium]|nr:F0F1 ATP synthase subunit C [Candidatus Hydrogenedentota bacterium]
MVIIRRYSRIILALLALIVCAFAFAPLGYAAEGAPEARDSETGVGGGLRAMGLAIGAGIAIAGAGLGTGRAQSGVGAGGTGALAEKPELFGNVLILFAIPETIVVFGFVIAIMLVNAI